MKSFRLGNFLPEQPKPFQNRREKNLMSALIYTAKAPSNIAFLKYWGKEDPQLQWPANDSLSMTLSYAYTETSAYVLKDTTKDKIFASQDSARQKQTQPDAFSKKIITHLDRLRNYLGTSQQLQIMTSNSFPSSCGIASSASGFAALTVAALAALTQTNNLEALKKSIGEKNILDLMRLGSGSACRSFHEGFVLWEKGSSPKEQTVRKLFPKSHWMLWDIVLMVSKNPKSISSSKAHLLAPSSPFFSTRIAGLKEKLQQMKQALSEKNLSLLGPLLEQEALEMHSIIMTTKEQSAYLTDESFAILEWLRQKRQKGVFRAYFTIDAGPNIHVICEDEDKIKFIQAFKKDFSKIDYLEDHTGEGIKLSANKEILQYDI